jgi:hypothetical protein
MSRRNSSKFVHVSDPTVFTAGSRTAEVELPVFSFSGRLKDSATSPPYVPSADIRLTRWQISAGAAGTVLNAVNRRYTHLQVLIGDNTLATSGFAVANGALDGATLSGTNVVPVGLYSLKSNYSLDGYSGRDAVDVAGGIGVNDHIIVSTRQWIKVRCLVSCGHQNVVVKIFGEYLNQGNDSGNPSITLV